MIDHSSNKQIKDLGFVWTPVCLTQQGNADSLCEYVWLSEPLHGPQSGWGVCAHWGGPHMASSTLKVKVA